MACFGSCGCGPCCMDASELAEIASSIDIEIFAEDYPLVLDPIDSATGISITTSGCCHVATWTRNPGFSYECKKTAQLVVDESITVSTKMIETKTHIMSPPMRVLASEIEGDCIFDNWWQDYLPPPADELCDEVVNCGTITATAQRKDQIWSAVGYSRKEFRVAIHKINLTCQEGDPPECKYVVEAAQGIDIAILGNLFRTQSMTATPSDVHACCEQLECYDNYSHDPEPTCEQAANLQNGWGGGATVRYWIVKYKVYDALEDIPSEIVFDSSDGWPCDRFQFCTIDAENISEDDLCFIFDATLDPYEGGEIYAIAFIYNCGFCLNLGVECLGNGSLVAENEPFVCYTRRGLGNSECDNAGFPDRFTGRTAGAGSFTGSGISEVFYSVRNSVLLSAEGCFEYPYEITGCQPDPDDRDACNFYDCPDCIGANYDGWILPYQFKFHTVDAYSFSQGPGTGVGSQDICVTWLRMKVTLNP